MKKSVLLSAILSLVAAQSLMSAEVLKQKITLDEAIKIALANSEKNKISKVDLEIAQAQYNQAMSANFPSLDLEVAAVKRDEDLINVTHGSFVLPQNLSTMLEGIAQQQIQSQIAALPPEYQAAAAAAAQAQLTGSDMSAIPLNFESTVMGDKTVGGSLKMKYPIYTGGKISAIQKQAKLGREIADEKEKRTSQEIVFDVKKYYYGALLAQDVAKLVEDTAQRMDLLNDLTKQMFEGGSEKVKKTDFYRTTIAASMFKAISAEMESNADLAKSALVFAMGVDPKSEITLESEAKNIQNLSQPVEKFIDEAYTHNTELTTLSKAIEVYDAKIDEAKSGYLPNIGLFGSLDKIDNNYNGGMSNDQNDDSWTLGVGASWNLFNGMRTKNEVGQAKLEKMKMKEQQALLKNALALQVKKAYFDTTSSMSQIEILKETVKNAEDNRDLNTRAYQSDMAETKDVVEAQVTEAQIKAKYFQTLHSNALSAANLDLIVGE